MHASQSGYRDTHRITQIVGTEKKMQMQKQMQNPTHFNTSTH